MVKHTIPETQSSRSQQVHREANAQGHQSHTIASRMIPRRGSDARNVKKTTTRRSNATGATRPRIASQDPTRQIVLRTSPMSTQLQTLHTHTQDDMHPTTKSSDRVTCRAPFKSVSVKCTLRTEASRLSQAAQRLLTRMLLTSSIFITRRAMTNFLGQEARRKMKC